MLARLTRTKTEMMKNLNDRAALTLVEAIVAVAIIATLLCMLAPTIMPARSGVGDSPTSRNEPPDSWSLSTVKNGGHWWVVGNRWGAHHPDCPCRERQAEKEMR